MSRFVHSLVYVWFGSILFLVSSILAFEKLRSSAVCTTSCSSYRVSPLVIQVEQRFGMADLATVAPIIEVACRAGEEFVQLYYETLDNRRHVMAPLYSDASQLLWNGSNAHGLAEVMQLLQKVPSSEHTLTSLDCQPIPAAASGGASSVLVSTEGQVCYKAERKTHRFTQQFVLSEHGGVWRIASDCFRFVD